MAQIQVIPPSPGFGSQLGQALGTGLSQGIGAGIQQMLSKRQEKQKMQELFSALGIRTPSAREEIPTAEIPSASTGGISNITPENILAASIINPQLGTTLSNLYKTQQKQLSEQKGEEIGQEALNRMSEILHKGNIGLGSGAKKYISEKTAEDVGEFESLSGALESLLVDKVSRGTLSNSRFKYITETLLPKAGDRQATIKGKLKALSKELGLELPKSLEPAAKMKGSDVLMRDPSGNLRKVPRDQAREAQQSGYKLEQ